ncbi:MAG: TIGR04219 family outer membrane beta-barrel protein [Pseudomonadota bacterium]
MKLRTVAIASIFAVLPATATADTILGLYVGAQGWNADYDGSYGAGDNIQPFYVDNDDTQTSFYVALEHPVPLLPNIKIRQNSLDVDNPIGSNASSFDNTDYTLYYEIFDNDIVALDVGLNGKQFDGTAGVQIGDTMVARDFSGVIPTAYGAARVGLPFTNWTVTGEAKAISFDDSELYDLQAAIEYRLIDNLAVDISISAGYRSMKVELDDVDNLYSDLKFDGPFLALDVHF